MINFFLIDGILTYWFRFLYKQQHQDFFHSPMNTGWSRVCGIQIIHIYHCFFPTINTPDIFFLLYFLNSPRTIPTFILKHWNSLKITVKVFYHSTSCLQWNPWYKKVTNWYFLLCLLASIKFYHCDQFFPNWWYLNILV